MKRESERERERERERGKSMLTVRFGDIHIYILYLFFFYHTTCESTCDTLASSDANQVDNTVSVAQGSTATPGVTEHANSPIW